MKKKTLVVISGVLGTLGRAYCTHFMKDGAVVVYGLSRKGLDLDTFAGIQPELFLQRCHVHKENPRIIR